MPAFVQDMSLVDVRHEMAHGDRGPVREAAAQFEALFIQTLMKNMRDASLGEGIFDSEQHKLYQGMLDQQFAIKMASGECIGIAEMRVRQLGGGESDEAADAGSKPAVTVSTGESLLPVINRPGSAEKPPEPEKVRFDSPEAFVRELWPHVKEIANKLGVEARGIMAQAALETGWGRHVPQGADGASSFNVFGIKADKRWDGDAVTKQTLEFRDGLPRPESARFRAYSSVAESVKDYFEFLTGNPRYDGVSKANTAADFGRSLAEAGYATDPDYADKIERLATGDRLDKLIGELEGVEPLLDSAGAAASP